MEQRRCREDREARGGRRQGGARLEVDGGHLAALTDRACSVWSFGQPDRSELSNQKKPSPSAPERSLPS
jgi:hypothetical protein